MNLPSSLALPQSNFFRSRIGLLVLLLVVALIGVGVFFFVLHPIAPLKRPTVATSPAVPATPRPAVKAPVVYGPPAPDWVKRTPMPPPPGAAPMGAVPGPATPLVAGAVPGAATQAVPGAAAIPGLSSTVPGTAGVVTETPKSLEASVLFQREQYVYTSGNRRDPFQSLLDGRFQSNSGDGALVDVGDIHLVGIMWGSSDKFALVEDTRGRGFVLRVGDPVVNGYISGISKAEIQVVQNAFGETQTLAIQLKPKEGDKNATRR
jgi:hypothetical protein